MSSEFQTFYNSIDRTIYIGQTAEEALQSYVSSDTTGVANYELDFFHDYSSNVSSSSSWQDRIDYINDEIKSVAGSNDYPNRKKIKLCFLTVFKHSTYYWR
jgi:hypothetical protein